MELHVHMNLDNAHFKRESDEALNMFNIADTVNDQVVRAIQQGLVSSVIRDANGNTVGRFYIDLSD